MSEPAAEPVLSVEGDFWTPSIHASAYVPPGQHGGCVGAMLAGAMERAVSELDANAQNPLLPLTFSAMLVRPTPVAPCTVDIDVVKATGRGAFLRATLSSEGRVTATGQAGFGRAAAIPGMPQPDDRPEPPEAARRRDYDSPGHIWFGDVAEVRYGADATVWHRYDRPLFSGETPLARIASVADWSSGFRRPDGWKRPLASWIPNIDLSVRLVRTPTDAWIGMRNRANWRETGIGHTETILYDRDGPIGGASQTMLLIPA